MLNILFIIDHLGCGGAERITINLAEHLAERGHCVTLAVLNGSKNHLQVNSSVHYLDFALSQHFAFGKMWKKRTLNRNEQQTFKQQMDAIKPDLTITGYNNGHWLAPYLTGNVWHWIHGELIEKRPSSNLFSAIKEFFRRIRHQRAFIQLFTAKKLIVVNQDLADHYAQLLPNPTIRVIGNGVDESRLRDQLTDQLIDQNADKKWDVLFLGRLVAIKQADHALRAFAASGLTGRMALAGDGNQRSALEQMAHTLGIADRVDFLGWVDQPAALIIQSKIMVLSSRSEGSPMALMEALILQTPVVAYDCCAGIRDALPAHVLAGALVTPQDIAQLSEKMAQVAQQPYRLSAQERNRLSMTHMGDQFLALGLSA